MAKQRLIETSIWQDKWFLSLSADAKLLFMFIITHPLMRESGFIEIPDMMVIPYLYPVSRLNKARQEIKNKVSYDNQFDLYLVINFYKKHCRSPHMIKPAINDLMKYKNSSLVSQFCIINDNIAEFKGLDIPYLYPIDTLPIGCNDNESDNELDNENENINKDEDKKHKYGEYKKVLLKDKEYKKLIADFGESKTKGLIKMLDEGKELKGYPYKNDNLAIRNWEKNKFSTTKKIANRDFNQDDGGEYDDVFKK